jgi:hypothetical protein
MLHLFRKFLTSFNRSVSNDGAFDRLQETQILTETSKRLPKAGKQKIEVA